MWKQEKSKDAIYFWRNILIWYFSGHKEYRTMSSIWKAAYESALRDSMKDCMWYQGYKEWYIKNGNNLQIFRQNMFNDLERKNYDHQINKSYKNYQQNFFGIFKFLFYEYPENGWKLWGENIMNIMNTLTLWISWKCFEFLEKYFRISWKILWISREWLEVVRWQYPGI